jgi:iron complex transport system ATP-binding protein
VTTLAARAVRAGYRGREVLHGIDLLFTGGERVALVGPNGSGKTTLLRTLAGTLRPASGDVALDGMSLAAIDARARARRIAVVPQTFTTPFAFTVREVAALGRTPYVGTFGRPAAADRAAVERALERTGCGPIADRPLAELSGGERQRAVLAMALAQEGDVLLLDEPTVHLDPAHQRSTLELVGRLARDRGVLVLAVLHDLNLAAALADRVVVLNDGRVAWDGSPAEVVTGAMVASVFGPGLVVGTREGLPFVLPRSLP